MSEGNDVILERVMTSCLSGNGLSGAKSSFDVDYLDVITTRESYRCDVNRGVVVT